MWKGSMNSEQQAENRLNLHATEMWFLRRMLTISYIDRVTNEKIFKRAQTKR